MIHKNKKRILAGLALTCLMAPAFSEQIMKVDTVNGKALYYKQYEASELTSVGCDPAIYTSMVNGYLKQRGAAHNLEYQARTMQNATQAPSATSGGAGGAGAGSCIEQATNQINNAASRIKNIFDIFNGAELDFSSLANNIGNQLLNGACQELNRVTGQMTGAALNNSGANNIIGTGTQIVNGGYGVNLGSGNMSTNINGSQILNSGNNAYNNNSNLNNAGGVGTQPNNAGSSGNSGYMCSWLGLNC